MTSSLLPGGSGAVNETPHFIAASAYDDQALADLYNRARTDYIVPMPMNGRRMAEYVLLYDVNLAASLIARDAADDDLAVAMLGVRGPRVWVTRLGVIPERRGKRVGQALMEALLQNGAALGGRTAHLEVIEGNLPAHRLFLMLGFAEVRSLLVLRRAPGPVPPIDAGVMATPLAAAAAAEALAARSDAPNWLYETRSLLNGGSLAGLAVAMPDGRTGAVVARRQPLQLSHVVVNAPDVEVAYTALAALHHAFPMLDTKLENLPAGDRLWPAFQAMGYIESFRRTEMLMHL